MFRFYPLMIALLMAATYVHAVPTPLSALLKERLSAGADLPAMDEERTWAISGVIPVQYFEYRLAHGTKDRDKKYYDNPWNADGSESHQLRFHLKNWTEMAYFSESRGVSRELADLEKQEVVNQRQFDAYLDLVNQLLQAQMLKVLDAREGQLQKSVDRSGQILGLPKADLKDLVKELDRLQKVSAENDGIKARTAGELKIKEVEASAKALIDAVGLLAKKVGPLSENSQPLFVQHNRLEARLQRIDKEIKWAEDRKLIDHIDFQRDTINRDDSVRIAFNIPFLRFDNETRARDRALLAVKESEARRKAEEARNELKRKRALVYGLAAEVESLKSRLGRTREISAKVRGVRDVDLRSVLSDFGFELERDVLVQALKFYTSYLEYLRDIGAFARMPNLNLLDPQFAELG